MSPVHYVNIQKQQLNINSNNKNNCADYALVKCNNNNNNNNTLKANPHDNTLKANPADNTLKANPDNTLKANPALCKLTATTTIKTTAQIMHW